MTDKDRWILRALHAGVVYPRPDGVIMRRKGKKWERVQLSTHAKTGRVYFNLTFDGITKSVLVNRVVALHWIPNPDDLPEVNHIDGDKAHNAKDNLEWADRSRQERHAQQTGLKSGRGSNNSMARLTAADVIEIRQNPGTTDREFAKKLNVSASTIRAARTGQTWRHL